MMNWKPLLTARKPYCVSVLPKRRCAKTPLLVCGRIAKTCKIALHGYVNCVRAHGLTVLDTDLLIDALRGFGAGLAYLEEAEQQSTLRISITTEAAAVRQL